jgi:hypothetical protein
VLRYVSITNGGFLSNVNVATVRMQGTNYVSLGNVDIRGSKWTALALESSGVGSFENCSFVGSGRFGATNEDSSTPQVGPVQFVNCLFEANYDGAIYTLLSARVSLLSSTIRNHYRCATRLVYFVAQDSNTGFNKIVVDGNLFEK